MSESTIRIVFPCDAYYPIAGQHVINQMCEGAFHRNKCGSFRVVTDTDGVKPPIVPDSGGQRAQCSLDCPKKGKHRKAETVIRMGPNGTYRTIVVSCYGRIMQNGVDITPPGNTFCFHCREQREFEKACRKAAKAGQPAPDRETFKVQPL